MIAKMPSSNQNLPTTNQVNAPGLSIPTEICLTFATGSFLIGMLGLQTISKCLQSAGMASEEVFRGELLPILHFPNPSNS